MFTCPVCYFNKMSDPPTDYNICPCCGTEFGNDDELRTHTQLREYWISTGAKWFFRTPPPLWNAWQQLSNAGVVLPYVAYAVYPSMNYVMSTGVNYVMGAGAIYASPTYYNLASPHAHGNYHNVPAETQEATPAEPIELAISDLLPVAA